MEPRIRTVKPELFKHEDLFEAEHTSQLPLRLAFIALFGYCDREGRFCWRPRRLKVELLPYDDVDMTKILDALEQYGFIKKYEHQGDFYGCIPSWLNHQRIDSHAAKSRYPGINDAIPLQAENANLQTEIKAHASAIDKSFKPNTTSVCLDESCGIKHRLQSEDPVVIDALYQGSDYQRIHVEVFSDIAPFSVTEHHSTREMNVPNEKEFAKASTLRSLSEMPSMLEGRVLERSQAKSKERSTTVHDPVVASNRQSGESSTITQIFEHWKKAMNHPNAKLDPKRKSLIAKALSFGYECGQLCQAISGCSVTPHNIGDNDRGQRYDGLHIILRDSDQIDRFIFNYQHPPRPITEADRRTKANVHTLQAWIDQKMAEGVAHGNA